MPSPRIDAWLLRLLAAVVVAGTVALLTVQGLTWRIDTWLYDLLLGRIDQPADDRIVLVVIDDKSLSALGRWPWPRGVHAELVRKLAPVSPRGIAFDVMLSEPDPRDAAGDNALAHAMQQAESVVSPVAVEASQPDGTLIEVLPTSLLIDASAALGHVEIDADADGVARHAHLYAGLGSAHWPAFALALRNVHPQSRREGALPGLRNPDGDAIGSPYLWNRDYRVLIPYVSGDGFQRASYINVLRGEVPAELFRDRWVLVGVTAVGLQRDVLVPGDGGHRIAGVEYHAHLLNTLLRGDAIVPLTPAWQLALGIMLALLPVLLYRRRHRLRRPWMVMTVAVVATLAICVLLLHHGRYWFPPTPTLLVISAGYLGWALLRLRRSHRLASSDGLTRLANRHVFDLTLERELSTARRSNRPLSLLLIDVDHFKPYNDHYGHQAGDELLRKVAEAILEWARRPRDLAARYGGDELALILPETSAHAATTIATTVLDDVRALALPHAQSQVAPMVTLSIGIATYYPILDGHDIDLLKRADAALYRAKREGRNRIHASSSATRPG
jgi:diguanylate cyclase (GGDEF)-like protein